MESEQMCGWIIVNLVKVFFFLFADQTMAKGKHKPAPGAVRDKAIHPNSRKAKRMLSKAEKRLKVNQKVTIGGQKLQATGEKLQWFSENLALFLEDDAAECFTPENMLGIADAFLTRFDEEVEAINEKNSVGGGKNKRTQHLSRLDVIKQTIKMEAEEFSGCGLEMPDLMDPKNFAYFREWNGELRFVQNIKLRRFKRKELENPVVEKAEAADIGAEGDMETS